MSEHTCGTCGHVCTDEIVCRFTDEDGVEIALTETVSDKPCDHWTERTDSVERIALDMLHSLDYWGRMNRIPNVSAEFAERLRAWGVEVDHD